MYLLGLVIGLIIGLAAGFLIGWAFGEDSYCWQRIAELETELTTVKWGKHIEKIKND